MMAARPWNSTVAVCCKLDVTQSDTSKDKNYSDDMKSNSYSHGRKRRKISSVSLASLLILLALCCCSHLARVVHAQQEDAAYARRIRQEEREQRRQERQRRRQEFRQQYEQQENFGNGTEFMSQAKDVFGVVFPTQKPKHVLEGAVQAVKSIVIGTVLGAVSFISLPIITGLQRGFAGFIAGGIVGSILGIITTVGGIVNGVLQLVKGTLNTWNAMQAFQEGKIWSSKDSEWQEYSMEQEAKDLSSNKKQSTSVKDQTFYELLEVKSDASSKEIKRSYYKKAKDVHPDKNPDDEDAAEKFLKLHTAYQTLMDDEARAAYDMFGATLDSGGSEKPMDPYVFFEILFGSQLVEPFIGELAVASFLDLLMKMSMGGDGKSQIPMDDLKILWEDSFKSQKRQLEIAQNLVGKIESYVNGTQSATEFKVQCFVEAGDIGQTAFGTRFLASIGKAFQLEAGQYLGYHWSLFTWPKGSYYSFKRWKNKNWNRVTSLRKTISVVGAAMQQSESDEVNEKDSYLGNMAVKADLQELLPLILEMAWAYNEQDIANTVHGACWRLFLDSSVSSEERLKRAQAIQIMGNEFVRLSDSLMNAKTCSDAPEEASEIMARLEVALKLAQQKAHGNDMADHSSEEMIRRAKRNADF